MREIVSLSVQSGGGKRRTDSVSTAYGWVLGAWPGFWNVVGLASWPAFKAEFGAMLPETFYRQATSQMVSLSHFYVYFENT